MSEKIIYTVDMALVLDGCKIVLIKRKYPPFQDKLVLPGGHIDAGEDPKAACLRETKEEIGVVLTPGLVEFLTILDRPGRDPRPDGHRVSRVFWTNLPSKYVLQNLRAGDDAKEFRLISLAELSAEKMGFDHFEAIVLLKTKL